jgi:hypothetical protein
MTLDLQAIAAWNEGVKRARREYHMHLFERPADEMPYCVELACWSYRTNGARCEGCYYRFRTSRSVADSAKQMRYRAKRAN